MAAQRPAGLLCIISKNEFLPSLPDGWRDTAGKKNNVDDEFTVLVQDKDFEGRDTYFEVHFLFTLFHSVHRPDF